MLNLKKTSVILKPRKDFMADFSRLMRSYTLHKRYYAMNFWAL
ncbi:hypothetical protein [Bartonella sp. AU55XJBT]|nr:hypothetical protein [Bartonella sp. AU55XJBT]